jgi:apolipoprotein D and lipocalin family protein
MPGEETAMLLKISILLVVAAVLALSLTRDTGAANHLPLATVEKVDLARYAGVWYEIARYPHRFQKGCLGSSATYSLREDGEIDVVNSCRSEKDGSLRQVKGRAWSVDPGGNARLKVTFFWPFRGDYWIIDLGKEYEYAVVGTPNRKYLWILSRTPVMADDLYGEIMERVKAFGFDPARVMRSPP